MGSDVGVGWVGFVLTVGMLLADSEEGTLMEGRVVLVVGGEVTVEISRGSFTAFETADSDDSAIAKSLRMVPAAGAGPTVSKDEGGEAATAVNADVVGGGIAADCRF